MCFMVRKAPMHALKRLLAIIGPGIFAIGYTIGTGSVTPADSMVALKTSCKGVPAGGTSQG